MRSRFKAITISLLLLGGCQLTGGSKSAEAKLIELVRAGEYSEAIRVAGERLEASPGDADLQRSYRRTIVFSLLTKGRQLTFEDRDEDALHYFNQAVLYLPDGSELIFEKGTIHFFNEAHFGSGEAVSVEGFGFNEAALR